MLLFVPLTRLIFASGVIGYEANEKSEVARTENFVEEAETFALSRNVQPSRLLILLTSIVFSGKLELNRTLLVLTASAVIDSKTDKKPIVSGSVRLQLERHYHINQLAKRFELVPGLSTQSAAAYSFGRTFREGSSCDCSAHYIGHPTGVGASFAWMTSIISFSGSNPHRWKTARQLAKKWSPQAILFSRPTVPIFPEAWLQCDMTFNTSIVPTWFRLTGRAGDVGLRNSTLHQFSISKTDEMLFLQTLAIHWCFSAHETVPRQHRHLHSAQHSYRWCCRFIVEKSQRRSRHDSDARQPDLGD